MADLTVPYVVSTPAGDFTLNGGALKTTEDLYWIQSIQGLDGAPIRAPVDNFAFGDGAHIHTFWKGPRRVTFDGVILIQSLPIGSACQEALNVMEEDMRAKLESTLADDFGVLTWTPLGMSERTLEFRCETIGDFAPVEDYALRSFSFGIVSDASDWTT